MKGVRHIVCISDTHFGSTFALCQKHRLDDGGWYHPSLLQKKLWTLWEDFWEWTYGRMNGEPFVLVHNGDIIDGVHHGTTALSSHNLTIQARIAAEWMEPHVANAEEYYQMRGTEAHVGKSAECEEGIAATLGSEEDEETGQFSRWELWMKFAGELIHFSHHIGTTSSTAYESSAPMREIVSAYVESGEFQIRPPSIIVRSHRHRYIRVSPPHSELVVTPGWQAKTPFVYKIDRLRGPMFGGVLMTATDHGIEISPKIYFLKQTKAVVI